MQTIEEAREHRRFVGNETEKFDKTGLTFIINILHDLHVLHG